MNTFLMLAALLVADASATPSPEILSVTPSLYVLRSGNLMIPVAKKFGTDLKTVVAENPGFDPSNWLPGQAIYLPIKNATDAATTWPLEQEILLGPKGRKKIALTFDAGADGQYLKLLVEHLAAADVHCSFFVEGKFAERYPSAIKILSASGHSIHNHSYSHPDFIKLSDERITEEIQKCEKVLADLTKQPIKPWFRFPFGSRNIHAREQVAKLGYRTAYWTLDSLDSIGGPKSADFIVERVTTAGGRTDSDKFLDGAIVLMHVGSVATVEAVPRIIENLKGRGFRVVTLDGLLEYESVTPAVHSQ